MEIARKHTGIYVLLFQLCVIFNSVLGSDAVYYELSKFVMLIFFCAMIFCIMESGFKIKVGTGLVLLIIFSLYSFLSLLWSHYQDVAMRQFVTQIQLYILCFFSYVLMQERGNTEDYINAMYVSGFVMIIWALYKYGGLSSYLLVMQTGTRLGGEIANENTYGLVFSNAAFSALYYAVLKGKKVHYLCLIPFVFFGLSSGSKKALLMVVVAVLGLTITKYGLKRVYKTILAAVAVFVVAWFVISLPIFSTINERMISFLSGEKNVSDLTRERMIEFGLDLFKQHPFFGYGLSNYGVYYGGTYSHNNFVEVVVSLGLFGFILYYLMYGIPIATLLHKWFKARRLESENIMLLLLLVVDLVFGYGMVQFYGKSSWLLLGTALAANDKLHCSVGHFNQQEIKDAGYYFEKTGN